MSEPKLLDLFCGMGGWSVGFHREGFECTGVDIVDVGYPYKLILRDIRDFTVIPEKTNPNLAPDVVVASPPCTEFSTLTRLSYQKGLRGKPEPEKGIELVRQAQRIIKEAQPRFWLVENVYGAIKHLEPVLGKPILIARPWVLWGNVNLGFIETKLGGDAKQCHQWEKGLKHSGRMPDDFAFNPLRSWTRARIPVFLSQQIARFCKSELKK